MKKFLIISRSYSENSGGYIVLHKLCDQINRLGGEAYMVPYVDSYEFGRGNLIKPVLRYVKEVGRGLISYSVNKSFVTPVLKEYKKIKNWDDWVVIYPEVVFGNPLKAKNVVRWFLHNPGHISGKIYYGSNELYFKFHSGIVALDFPGSKMSSVELKIVHFPLDLYNEIGVSAHRRGTAYCIRKGKGKPIVHDLQNSILIDGKSHAEIAAIFKTVKQFISYDVYTAYSGFAALCGCESVVVPDPGMTENDWYPKEWDRHGVAYGFENLENSKKTRHMLIERMHGELEKNAENAKAFMAEVNDFFEKSLK